MVTELPFFDKLLILASYNNLRIRNASEFANFSPIITNIKIGHAFFHIPRNVFSETFAEIDLSWCNMIKVIRSPLSCNRRNSKNKLIRPYLKMSLLDCTNFYHELPAATSFRLLLWYSVRVCSKFEFHVWQNTLFL